MTMRKTLAHLAPAIFRPLGPLPDWEVQRLCGGDRPMIYPYSYRSKGHGTSHGVSYFGYDIRLGRTWKVPSRVPGAPPVDLGCSDTLPRYDVFDSTTYTLNPLDFVLAETLERFTMPDDVFATCVGKSTLARLGVSVIVTPLEPGWSGVLTLELCLLGDRSVTLHEGQGIAQLLFHRGSRPDVTYDGKYQHQLGVNEAIAS